MQCEERRRDEPKMAETFFTKVRYDQSDFDRQMSRPMCKDLGSTNTAWLRYRSPLATGLSSRSDSFRNVILIACGDIDGLRGDSDGSRK